MAILQLFLNSSTITIFFLSFWSIILVVIRIWKASSESNKNRRSNLPPGLPSLPLIGHLHLLLGALPFRSFDTLAKTYGGIMQLNLGQVPIIVISSPEMAKEALKTHDPVFAARIVWYDYKSIIYLQCLRRLLATYA